MLNRTDIINMALRRCGAAGVNLGFQNAPDSAIALAAFKRCYAYVLTQYPWSFAQRYELLAQNAERPVMGYRYAYTIPGDCKTIIDCHRYCVDMDGDVHASHMFREPEAKYEIIGGNIYSNADHLAIRYVSDKETSVPEPFGEALAWYLAFDMCQYHQQGEPSNGSQMYQMYLAALAEAKVDNDVQLNPEEPAPWKESRFIRDRFAGVWD